MEMKMLNGLAGVFSAVGNNAVAVFETFLLCDEGDGLKALCSVNGSLGADIVHRLHVHLGDDEDMNGSLRSDITECKNVFVLVNLIRGDIACDNFAEKAVIHCFSSLAKLGSDEIVNHCESVVYLQNFAAAAHGAVRLAAALAADYGSDGLDDVTGLDTGGNSFLTAECGEADLAVLIGSDNGNDLGILVAEEVAHLADVSDLKVGTGGGNNIQIADLLCGEEEALNIAGEELVLELIDVLTHVTHLNKSAFKAVDKLAGIGLENTCCLVDGTIETVNTLHECLAGDSFNAAYAGSYGAFADDVEGTDKSCVAQMSTAAELDGLLSHGDNADDVAVLLAEESGCTHLLSLVNGHLADGDIQTIEDHVANALVDGKDLIGGECGEVSEVETEMVGLNERASLVDMVAQNVLESSLEQMSCGVGTHDGTAALGIDIGADFVTDIQAAADHFAVVEILAALVLLNIADSENGIAADNTAVVSNLTAHFGVHGGGIEDNDALSAFGKNAAGLAALNKSENLCAALVIAVAEELGGSVVKAEVKASPCVGHIAAGSSCALALLIHKSSKSVHVNAHALFLNHLDGQIDGETIGIIKLESVGTGEYLLALCLMLLEDLAVDAHTCIDGAGEVLFLGLDNAGDVVCLFAEIGIMTLILADNGLNNVIEEGLIDAEELTVTCCAAEQTAENIAAAFVGGQNAVADHEGGRADMVGDDTQRNVLLVALIVVSAGDLADAVGDVHNGINIEEAGDVLAYAGKTLETHAGVDVLLGEIGVVAFAVIVELGENVVPNFHEAIAVAAGLAVGLATAVFDSAVIVDLGAGAAGTGAVLPEVIGLAHTDDVVGGNTDFLGPYVESLIVIEVDAGIKSVGLKAYPFGRGEEFPAPCKGFALEIIAEGEVTEHLEIGAVAGGLTDVFDIAGADALLAGADSASGGLNFTGEVGLHGSHTGVDEKQRGVILRNEGEAGESEVVFGLKELQEHFAKLVKADVSVCHS